MDGVVVRCAKTPCSVQSGDGLVQHVLFLLGIGVVYESGVIVIVLSWLESGVVDYKKGKRGKKVLTESSEVLSFEDFGILRQKSLFWDNFMTNWVFFADSVSRCVCI